MRRPAAGANARVLERWRRDPIAWFREVLGGPQPWSRQVEIIESVRDNRETNVHSGNAIGKDWLAARIALWWLFTRRKAIVVTTATKELQVDTVLWGEIREAYHASKHPLGGKLMPAASHLVVDEKERWYAIGVVAAHENAFAGFHGPHVLVIEDEAAGLREIIGPAVLGVAAGENDRILRIGNPICGPTHYFARACSRPDIPGTVKTIRVSGRESPNYVAGATVIPGLASRQSVEAIERTYGKGSVVANARVDGLFPGAAADGLISLEHLALARSRFLAGHVPHDEDVLRFGLDVARFGDDLSDLRASRGCKAWELPGWPKAKLDGADVARHLAQAVRDYPTVRTIAIDGGGLGAGPLDAIKILREAGEFNPDVQILDIQFGARASDPTQWVDVRTELWWRMRDWFRDVAAIEVDIGDLLGEELLAPTYKMQGKAVRLEAKEELKKADRLGRSPDRADALALAVAGHLVGNVRARVGGDVMPSVLTPEKDPRVDDEDDDVVGPGGERLTWTPTFGGG